MMEILMQVHVLEQAVERDEPGKITENSYMEGPNEFLFYHSTRNRGCCCLLCRHWTAYRDLRQKKRFLVVYSNGHCNLGERTCVEGHSLKNLQNDPHACNHVCPKFEKISELM